MTEHPNEDVAVVREALELLPEMPDSELNPEGEEQARESKRLVAQEGRAALDRLQARLKAAEAETEELLNTAYIERDEARADRDELAEVLAATYAERDEARADAERLAARLEDALTQVECKGWCADAGCPFCGGFLRPARAALAAHTPHLPGPKRKPIGTFYTTEDAVDGLEILQEPAPEKTLDRLRKRVQSGDWKSDDVGPPAPGEGEPEDGYPNPEIGMEC